MTHAYLNCAARSGQPATPCVKAHFDSRRHALKFINGMRKNNGGISAGERPGTAITDLANQP